MNPKNRSPGTIQNPRNLARSAGLNGPSGLGRNTKALAEPKQRTKIQQMVTILATANQGDAKTVLRPGTVDQRCPRAPQYCRTPPTASAMGMNHSSMTAPAVKTASQRCTPRTLQRENNHNGPKSSAVEGRNPAASPKAIAAGMANPVLPTYTRQHKYPINPEKKASTM